MDFARKKIWWLVGAALLIVVAVFFVIRARTQAAEATLYETAPAERGALTASVAATGTVRASQVALLTWQTGGRVEVVQTVLGAVVSADQQLAALAPSSISQGIVMAEVDLVAAQKKLDLVQLSNLSLAQAQQNLANAKQAAEDAQADYDRLNRARVSDELIENTQDQIDQLTTQLKFQQWVFNKFYADYYDGNPRKSQQIVNLINTKERLKTLIAKQNWYSSRPTALAIEKAQAALRVAQAKMQDAQREVDRLGNGQNADDLAAAQAGVDAAQATLNLSKVVAPFAGVVTEISIQPGDVVTRGAPAFRVEDLNHLFIDLSISEVDINSLAVGQPVSVTFDAVIGKTYTGQVAKINLAGDLVAGAVTFPVTVELTDADEFVKPGMTAAVDVTIKEVQDALLIPSRAVRYLDGERVVYILKDNQPLAVKIRLGAITDGTSEVVGGDLQPGDLIILNPPSSSVTGAGL